VLRFSARFAVAAVALLAFAPGALASVGVGSNAGSPKLRVDAKGNAEISYTQGRQKTTVLVPAQGPIEYGGTLAGRDVSKPAKSPKLPFLKVLRSGPHGWTYALQTWPARSGPVELRFSRWQGTPTKLTLKATRGHSGIALHGTVTYGGKPIPIVSEAPGGLAIREYVYLDQRLAGRWQIVSSVSVERNGTYRHVLNTEEIGNLFRAAVAGPNIGSVYAPDVVVQIPPP